MKLVISLFVLAGCSITSSTLVKNSNVELEFLHITKTGGTSVEDLGRRLGFDWGFNDRKHLEPYFLETIQGSEIGCHSAEWHWPKQAFKKNPYLKCKSDAACTKKTFTVVRHPFSRVVSEFNWEVNYYNGMKERDEQSAESALFWNAIKELGLAKVDLNSSHALNRYLQNKLTVAIMNENKHELKKKHVVNGSSNMFCSHYKRQCEYVYPFCNAWSRLKVVDHVLTHENLENDMKNLLLQYNFVKRNLRSRTENKVLKKLNSSPQSLNCSHLNDETRKLILEYYIDDFRMFNYSADLKSVC